MTVTNTTLRNDYLGNGSTTVYAFTFIVLNQAGQVTDPYTIQVITTDLGGIETIKTQNTDYTVQLGVDGLGTVTFTTAPAANHKITLLSNVPNTQETDYVKAGTDKFPAESHEKALDKLTLIAKQFTEKFDRTISVPKSSVLTDIEFPISPVTANQVVVINSAGDNLTTANLLDINTIPVSTFASTLLDDVDAAAGRATLDAQQSNVNLTALAGLTGAANKVVKFTGVGAMELADLVPATESVAGIAEIATAAEAAAAIDDTTFITPLKQRIVQVVNTQTGAVATGATVLPFDDTITTNTEGSQFMSLNITPTSATDILDINVDFNGGIDNSNQCFIALFSSASSNALAVAAIPFTPGFVGSTNLKHRLVAGTTSTLTFTVRAGGNGGTVTFNGQGGTRKFGGVFISSITITQIKA